MSKKIDDQFAELNQLLKGIEKVAHQFDCYGKTGELPSDLSRGRASINRRLHIQIAFGMRDAAKSLSQLGVDKDEKIKGRNVYEFAKDCGREEIAVFLQKKGLQPSEKPTPRKKKKPSPNN